VGGVRDKGLIDKGFVLVVWLLGGCILRTRESGLTSQEKENEHLRLNWVSKVDSIKDGNVNLAMSSLVLLPTSRPLIIE
jgi:hypothetical protein